MPTKGFAEGPVSKEEAGFRSQACFIPVQCSVCGPSPGRRFYPNQTQGPGPRPTESELGRRDRDICPWHSMVWILMGDQGDGARGSGLLTPLPTPPSRSPTGFYFELFVIL